jgi:hypothetical protein
MAKVYEYCVYNKDDLSDFIFINTLNRKNAIDRAYKEVFTLATNRKNWVNKRDLRATRVTK